MKEFLLSYNAKTNNSSSVMKVQPDGIMKEFILTYHDAKVYKPSRFLKSAKNALKRLFNIRTIFTILLGPVLYIFDRLMRKSGYSFMARVFIWLLYGFLFSSLLMRAK